MAMSAELSAERGGGELFLEDLIGSHILNSGHQFIGHVVEVAVTPAPEYRVIGLMYGRSSWLYRLRVLEPLLLWFSARGPVRMIAWRAVARVERFTVILAPGWEAADEALEPTQPGAAASPLTETLEAEAHTQDHARSEESEENDAIAQRAVQPPEDAERRDER